MKLLGWISKILSAAGTVILFSLIFYRLNSVLSLQIITLLYLVPVVISAALWGVFAGVTASILSFILYNYYFIPPYRTLRVAHPQDFLAMLVLLGVAILISTLMARIQSNLKQAQAREHEARQLSLLSLELVTQQDVSAIAKALVVRLNNIFQNSSVVIEVNRANQIVRAQSPENSTRIKQPPTRHVPFSSPSGLTGDIWIWLDQAELEPEEERLLETFARQGALAFDRADLADARTRARVVEESDKLKTAILSSVSHELRTPLSSIQAAATSLFNPNVDLEPEARSELQSLLLEETNRMIQVIGNLLNMSRIEAGALKLQRQWNSFAEIVDLSIRQLGHLPGEHQIEIDVSEDLPLVAIDSVLMEQVIVNLVRNSLRFSPVNAIVYISAVEQDQMLLVRVTNIGPHIPEEYLLNIFEKFFPIPGRDNSQGIGLGLSICKGVVEAHGGKIWAENLPVGVAFLFTLPLLWEGSGPLIPAVESEEA